MIFLRQKDLTDFFFFHFYKDKIPLLNVCFFGFGKGAMLTFYFCPKMGSFQSTKRKKIIDDHNFLVQKK